VREPPVTKAQRATGASGTMRAMIESRYPNRWFGSNPQAVTNQGKKLTAFDRDVPKDWRTALGVSDIDAESNTAPSE